MNVILSLGIDAYIIHMPYVTIHISDGIGNRLFQIAAMLGYAERHGHTPIFVKKFIQPSNYTNVDATSLSTLFPTIPTLYGTVDWTEMNMKPEDAFTHIDLPYSPDHICLIGFFQSELYFPRNGIQCTLSAVPVPPLPYENAAFLHVRRGDYLSPYTAHHRVDLTDYYRHAIQFLPVGCHIFVCSDDIPWCRTELPLLCGDGAVLEFIDCDTITTLAIMMRCRYGGICANSTFSWWGGYFNHTPSSIILFPDTWGYPPLPPIRDLYPSWGLQLPVGFVEKNDML